MKYVVTLLLLLCLLLPQAAISSGIYLAWFTDASIKEGSKLPTPPTPLDENLKGTKSVCVDLAKGCTFAVPSLSDTTRGMIGFWLRPKEDGKLAKGGAEHILMKAGDPKLSGLQVSWDNAKGLLRFTMTGKNGADKKTTVCRADISDWKANDWHHIQVAWLDVDSKPVGLAIWIDRVAEASYIFGGTKFMNPPSGNNITIGDATSQAFMDELVFRGNAVELDSGDTENSAHSWVTRDFYRTAPYTSIQITHTPNRVNSDFWVLLDKQKQFGLLGKRLLNTSSKATTMEYLTDFSKRYSPWSEYDAKPYITWELSDTTYATIDANGLVTGHKATIEPIKLSASFAGLYAAYPLDVRKWDDKPDLCLEFVERTPRYDRYAKKNWSAAGDTVTSIAHVGNFGTAAANNINVKIEKANDTNNNFKVDPGETWSTMKDETINSLAAGAETTVSQTWIWPTNGLTTGSVFIRVTIDPDNTIDEICEANNQRCEKSNARAYQWGRPTVTTDSFNSFADDYNNRVINLVGSFSDYDWYNAEVDRVAMILPETVLPTTTPNGILDSIRIDMYYDWQGLPNSDDELFGINNKYFDGGFPKMEPHNGATNMDYDTAVGHEVCHTTLGQPDLYGQETDTDNMFVKDPNGKPYAATPVYPVTRPGDSRMAMLSAAVYDHTDECGVGDTVVMNICHLWLGHFSAGLTQYNRQGRYDLMTDFWFVTPNKFGEWIPTTSKLRFVDINDAPLKNARLYIYQITSTGEWWTYGNKYYSDRPKFIGVTDNSGYYTIPTTTCEYWDDWNTDKNDGIVSASTPFATADRKASPPNGGEGDMLLIRVVGDNDQVEFHILPLTDVNAAFFSGITDTATYPILTSLASPSSAPKIVAPKDPAAGKAPIAKVTYDGQTYASPFEVTVPAGTKLTFDGSPSADPEGFSPLRYRWDGTFGRCDKAEYAIDTTGRSPGDYEVKLRIIDSVRYSEQVVITVHIQ